MMRRLFIAGLLGSLSAPAFADSTINSLSAGTALGGTEKIPMFQTANPAVVTTPSALLTYSFGAATTTLTLPAGTTANPSFIFSGSSTNTGMFTQAADQVSVSVQGTETFRWASSNATYNFIQDFNLYNSGARLGFGAAPDVYLTRIAAGVLEVNNGTGGTSRELQLRSVVHTGAAPTPTGTCAAPAMAGGNTAGTMTTTTGCAGTTIILTFLYTAPTGWACNTTNRTVSTRVMPQTGSTTATATFTGTTSNGDVLQYACSAY